MFSDPITLYKLMILYMLKKLYRRYSDRDIMVQSPVNTHQGRFERIALGAYLSEIRIVNY